MDLPIIADSNWLLSTLVQSAAALVAIVGGLLVTRLVTLATERNGLERRIGQLDRVASTRREQADLAAKAWLEKDVDAFLDDCEVAVVESFGEADFDTLYEAEDHAGRTKDELRPYFDRFCARVRAMNRTLLERHGPERPDDWPERRDELEKETSHSDRYLLGLVIGQLEKTIWRRPPSQDELLAPITPSSVYTAAHRTTADRRYDETVREAETARAAQRMAEVELDQTRTELAALGRPVGFVGAFRVLVGIALTGIVLPLAVMSNGAYEVPAAGRIVLVTLFVLALITFMLFLRAEIRRSTNVSK